MVVWALSLAQSGVDEIIHENVSGFKLEYLQELLPEADFEMESDTFSPSLMGIPVERRRKYTRFSSKKSLLRTGEINMLQTLFAHDCRCTARVFMEATRESDMVAAYNTWAPRAVRKWQASNGAFTELAERMKDFGPFGKLVMQTRLEEYKNKFEEEKTKHTREPEVMLVNLQQTAGHMFQWSEK
eukprot:6357767-Amphidinium_carterae.1